MQLVTRLSVTLEKKLSKKKMDYLQVVQWLLLVVSVIVQGKFNT